MRNNWKLTLSIIVFALCIAPTIISYDSYSFRWDDSDYLVRSITASRAFWSGHKTELRDAMVSIHPPVMTLLGIPWGPLKSWDAAGKCFLTLNIFTSFFVACSLFLLLRAGIKPLYLIIASICVFAALGPYPSTADIHTGSTGFLADALFAWVTLAAVLLIPLEAISEVSSTLGGIARGLLWAVILSAGAMTKASFLYFIVLVVPILLLIRIRRLGLRSAVIAFSSLFIFSVPAIFYWLKFGLPALRNGWAASFGHDAPMYTIPLSQFLSRPVRESPIFLLPVIFTAAGVIYFVAKKRADKWNVNVLPLLIILGYFAIGIASSNRQARYLLPGIIAPPFLIALLISGKTFSLPRKWATVAAVIIFSGLALAGIPMLHRPNRESIGRSDEIVNLAIKSNLNRILVGTDSGTLNGNLIKVAISISARPSLEGDSLGWHAAYDVPLETDYRAILDSDLVVFQDKTALLGNISIFNKRIAEYEQYALEHSGGAPVKTFEDVRVYQIHHDLK